MTWSDHFFFDLLLFLEYFSAKPSRKLSAAEALLDCLERMRDLRLSSPEPRPSSLAASSASLASCSLSLFLFSFSALLALLNALNFLTSLFLFVISLQY